VAQTQHVALQRQSQVIARYVAVSFRRAGKGFAPGPAAICRNAGLALQCAESMVRDKEITGAVAFLRYRNLDSKNFGAAVILQAFGDTPEDFDIG